MLVVLTLFVKWSWATSNWSCEPTFQTILSFENIYKEQYKESEWHFENVKLLNFILQKLTTTNLKITQKASSILEQTPRFRKYWFLAQIQKMETFFCLQLLHVVEMSFGIEQIAIPRPNFDFSFVCFPPNIFVDLIYPKNILFLKTTFSENVYGFPWCNAIPSHAVKNTFIFYDQ